MSLRWQAQTCAKNLRVYACVFPRGPPQAIITGKRATYCSYNWLQSVQTLVCIGFLGIKAHMLCEVCLIWFGWSSHKNLTLAHLLCLLFLIMIYVLTMTMPHPLANASGSLWYYNYGEPMIMFYQHTQKH